MKKSNTPPVHFDVSSGLKTILGSELITNDEVAIFELVKNSFDAGATRVDLYFDDDRLVISDNGSGMSYEDIKGKWLFVAYSSKRNGRANFRDEIAERKNYAGSKGIGRFSSDRLGAVVLLQTRTKDDPQSGFHSVEVNWSLFDADHQVRFEDVGIKYKKLEGKFSVPEDIPVALSGTVVTITHLHRFWDRNAILGLKNALAKLINPFGAAVDGFKIFVHAPNEVKIDDFERASALGETEPIAKKVVNGEVGNFLFSTLQEKTTFLHVWLEDDELFTELIDRGELIYKVKEKNQFPLLHGSGFRCQLFFLNTSAKMTFARRMGVPSVQFGSVFLFRNGFRVFPVGEDGDDWFEMDRRKAQGYKRFLGTRDVIGRLDVSGSDHDFQETSSRNAGLIETPAVVQLKMCFREYCLKRLEKYIVPVTYVDKEDRHTDDVSRLLTDPGRARVALAVAKLVDEEEIELLDYSRRLIGIISEKSSQFETSLTSLRAIAEKTQDPTLFANIEEAEKRFDKLRKSEMEARRQADEERTAKEVAQARARKAEIAAAAVTEQLAEEKKRSLFLTSISTLDTDTILNLHHQVTMYAVDIQQQIENFILSVSDRKVVSASEVVDALDTIALLNRKVMGVSKFATKANFRLQSETIEANLGDYVEQYINDVAKQFLLGPLSVSVVSDGKGSVQRFKPIDVSVVIDNLIANARKKQLKATQVLFEISHPNKDVIHIAVSDNGRGFDKSIVDIDRVFDKGFTLTDGSGLGLYHVRQVLGEMNGTISALAKGSAGGAGFLIRISK